MRKFLIALLAIAGTSLAASAQWNGPPAACAGGNCGSGGGGAGNVFGWNHDVTKCVFWWRKNCNGKQACNTGPVGPTPGTLVFPQHQFIRSPRDYFMWEPQR